MTCQSAPKAGALPDCATPRRAETLRLDAASGASDKAVRGNSRQNMAGTGAQSPGIIPESIHRLFAEGFTIPRRITDRGHFMVGKRVTPGWLAMYDRDGELLFVFDSDRSIDLHFPDCPDGQPITKDDLSSATWTEFSETHEDGVTYFIGGEIGAIKIGRSVNVAVRLKDIQACSPIPVRLLATRKGVSKERIYHELFAHRRLHGEWFERCPEIEAEIARLNQPRRSNA